MTLLLGACDPEPSPSSEARTPRGVILLSLDNLAATHMDAYGYERLTSPSLTKWLNESCRFEHAIAAANWTLPSHMSMLTGVRPRRHGVVDHSHQDPKAPLISSVLQGRDIATGAFVNHTNVSKLFGFDRGFDTFFQDLDGENPHQVIEQATRWLEAQNEGPFFAFVHLFGIHWPHTPERLSSGDYQPTFDPEYRGEVQGIKKDVDRLMAERKTPQEHRDLIQLEALYDEDILAMDRIVDQFLQDLQTKIDLDDVLLILTSDHGEAFKEHGYYGHGVSFNRPEIQVPLAIRWPSRIAPTLQSNATFTTLDIAPTILGAFSLDQSDMEVESLQLQGVNLLETAKGSSSSPNRVLLSESSLATGSLRFDRFALWDGPYKYIYFPSVERFEKSFAEALYDLRDDPEEARSLLLKRPEMAKRFRELGTELGFTEQDMFVLAFGPQSQPGRATLTVEGGVISPEIFRLKTIRNDQGQLVAPDWIPLPLEEDLFEDGKPVESLTLQLAATKTPHAVFFRPSEPDSALQVEGFPGLQLWQASGTKTAFADASTTITLESLGEKDLRSADDLAPNEILLFRAKLRTHPSTAQRASIDEETRNLLIETGYIKDTREASGTDQEGK